MTKTDPKIASAMPLLETITVDLGARSYEIKIGEALLQNASAHMAPFITGKHLIIISDSEVGPLYQHDLATNLSPLATRIDCLQVSAGEASKSLSCYSALMEDILALNVDRKTVLIALGGGVIGDLVGFAAASLLRGVDFIQIPTSLLAQVDSSVGGKTGINAKAGKNLIGAFYQPKLVLADIDVLGSLSARQMRAGYAEIVKYGLLGDAEFFEWLEAHGQSLLDGDAQAIMYAVTKSCQAKADIVAADETEAGKRALLNLGHTFAHAFEAEAGYDGRLLHGEAVAAGLALAFGFSNHLGEPTSQECARITAHLKALGLPASIADLPAGQADPQRLLFHMMKDKKTSGGQLTFILAKEIGAAYIASNVPSDEVINFLERQS